MGLGAYFIGGPGNQLLPRLVRCLIYDTARHKARKRRGELDPQQVAARARIRVGKIIPEEFSQAIWAHDFRDISFHIVLPLRGKDTKRAVSDKPETVIEQVATIIERVG